MSQLEPIMAEEKDNAPPPVCALPQFVIAPPPPRLRRCPRRLRRAHRRSLQSPPLPSPSSADILSRRFRFSLVDDGRDDKRRGARRLPPPSSSPVTPPPPPVPRAHSVVNDDLSRFDASDQARECYWRLQWAFGLLFGGGGRFHLILRCVGKGLINSPFA